MSDTERTLPWHHAELAHADGVPHVYTQASPDAPLLVRLPGRIFATVAALRQRGHVVTLPRMVRSERPVIRGEPAGGRGGRKHFSEGCRTDPDPPLATR